MILARPHGLRLGTWLTVIAVAIALAVYNLRGRGEPPELRGRQGWYQQPGDVEADWPAHFEAEYDYGWPLTYGRFPCYVSRDAGRNYYIQSMSR